LLFNPHRAGFLFFPKSSLTVRILKVIDFARVYCKFVLCTYLLSRMKT